MRHQRILSSEKFCVENMATLLEICSGLPVNRLPPAKQRDESVPHAPVRVHNLNQSEQKVSNTLQT